MRKALVLKDHSLENHVKNSRELSTALRVIQRKNRVCGSKFWPCLNYTAQCGTMKNT